MNNGYGISGIGYDPLGRLGLGGIGSYGSYDAYMPSMLGMTGLGSGMGMNGSIFGTGGMGMMGYYPQYLTQMQQAQNQIELMQVQHAGDMHKTLLNNEILAHEETDSALARKILTNGDVKLNIERLYLKVREGDQNGICQMFDELRDSVLRTYRNEFAAKGDSINQYASATKIITDLYAQLITAETGELHTLDIDIKKYGDGSFRNGFMQGFRKDHHSMYIDETLNHCYGLPIDHKGQKDRWQTEGKAIGHVASAVEKGVYGGTGAVAATGAALGLWKFIRPKTEWFKTMGKCWKPAALIGAGLGIAADILWKATA